MHERDDPTRLGEVSRVTGTTTTTTSGGGAISSCVLSSEAGSLGPERIMGCGYVSYCGR